MFSYQKISLQAKLRLGSLGCCGIFTRLLWFVRSAVVVCSLKFSFIFAENKISSTWVENSEYLEKNFQVLEKIFLST